MGYIEYKFHDREKLSEKDIQSIKRMQPIIREWMEINAFLPSPDRKNTFYKQRETADGVIGAIMSVLSIERDSVALCDLPFSCVLENCVYIEKNKRYNLMQCLDYSLAAWFFHWIDKPIEGYWKGSWMAPEQDLGQ